MSVAVFVINCLVDGTLIFDGVVLLGWRARPAFHALLLRVHIRLALRAPLVGGSSSAAVRSRPSLDFHCASPQCDCLLLNSAY